MTRRYIKQGPQSATFYKPHEWRLKLLQMALQNEIRSTTERRSHPKCACREPAGRESLGADWTDIRIGIDFHQLSKNRVASRRSLGTQPSRFQCYGTMR